VLNLKIVPDDGEAFTVVATSRDIAKWEKTTKGATFAGFQNEQRLTDLYAIAYHAAKRRGLWPGTLKELEDGADLDIIDDDEDGEPDPTQPAA
jgi:hypothetical protein